MVRRRTGGDETWFRLREWIKGQKESERLSAHILSIEGYKSIDPSHPLGGPDGLKDVVCDYDGKKWISAAYFPKGKKSFGEIKEKFEHDLAGIVKNEADGIAFVTNQELTLGEREKIHNLTDNVDLFHLERIAHILDRPACYGLRLDFLDIEMSKEEQLAFIATKDEAIERLRMSFDEFIQKQKSDKKENGFINPIYVTPNYDTALSSAAILGRSKGLHKCSYCGFGFYINDITSSIVAITNYEKSVTCPKCGNTDYYY